MKRVDTWKRRVATSLWAMFGTWILSCGCLLLLRLTFEPDLQLRLLALYSFIVAGLSYLFFAAPLVLLLTRRHQIRFFYLIMFLSLACECAIFHYLFREWPWAAFSEPWPSAFMPAWFLGFTVTALGSYFILLWFSERSDKSESIKTAANLS